MANVIYFTPRSERDGKRNLDDFVEYCRDRLTLYEDQGGFDVDTWVFDNGGRAIAMRFARYSPYNNPYAYEPLEEAFASFAKAYIRYQQSMQEVASVSDKLVALRTIHDALLEVHGEADPLKVDGLVQQRAAELLEQRYPGAAKLYHYGGQLEVLYKFLKEKAMTPALPVWKRPWRKKEDKAIRTDRKSRQWQEARCPSMHQMLALADCFARAESEKDRYWSAVLGLLMFAPGRAGELSALTVDSLYEEGGRLGVQWYGEKGFGETIKWVPAELEGMVREAFSRLVEIGAPAREAARFAHENPGVFPRHDNCITPEAFPEDEPLDALQFAHAMNLVGAQSTIRRKCRDYKSEQAWRILTANTKWVRELIEGGDPSYGQLAEYFRERYGSTAWPYLPGRRRYVWEALLLTRENEFDVYKPVRPFSWVMPTVNQVNDQLAQRPLKYPMSTIFQRFGIKDEDGSEIRLTSHQLRVWLSTTAERGGMDAWQLAQWAGRARMQDNRAYDLRTEQERETQARDVLNLEERPSPLEAIKMNLPVSYADLGLNRPGIADVTEYGMCTHDYAMSPCTKGGECMTCKEHVCIKGMPKTLERIKRLEEMVASQYEKAQRDAGAGAYGADRWVTHLGWKLAHIRTQRARLESDETPEGAVLWIPPEHDPSPVKRALQQRGYASEPTEEELVDESVVRGLLEG